MAQCQGPHLKWKDLFLAFTYTWQEDFAKTFKVPRALSNVNPARSGQ